MPRAAVRRLRSRARRMARTLAHRLPSSVVSTLRAAVSGPDREPLPSAAAAGKRLLVSEIHRIQVGEHPGQDARGAGGHRLELSGWAYRRAAAAGNPDRIELVAVGPVGTPEVVLSTVRRPDEEANLADVDRERDRAGASFAAVLDPAVLAAAGPHRNHHWRIEVRIHDRVGVRQERFGSVSRFGSAATAPVLAIGSRTLAVPLIDDADGLLLLLQQPDARASSVIVDDRRVRVRIRRSGRFWPTRAVLARRRPGSRLAEPIDSGLSLPMSFDPIRAEVCVDAEQLRALDAQAEGTLVDRSHRSARSPPWRALEPTAYGSIPRTGVPQNRDRCRIRADALVRAELTDRTAPTRLGPGGRPGGRGRGLHRPVCPVASAGGRAVAGRPFRGGLRAQRSGRPIPVGRGAATDLGGLRPAHRPRGGGGVRAAGSGPVHRSAPPADQWSVPVAGGSAAEPGASRGRSRIRRRNPLRTASSRPRSTAALAGRMGERTDLAEMGVRIERSGHGEFAVRISAPRAAGEGGRFRMNGLADHYRSAPEVLSRPLEEAVFFDCFDGRFTGDSPGAVRTELMARRPGLAEHWVVSDLSVPLPEGAHPADLVQPGVLRGAGPLPVRGHQLLADRRLPPAPRATGAADLARHTAETAGLRPDRRGPVRGLPGADGRTDRPVDLAALPRTPTAQRSSAGPTPIAAGWPRSAIPATMCSAPGWTTRRPNGFVPGSDSGRASGPCSSPRPGGRPANTPPGRSTSPCSASGWVRPGASWSAATPTPCGTAPTSGRTA